MLSIAQDMVDGISAYETKENRLRSHLPKVFSVGEFETKDAVQMMVVQCKDFFEKMFNPIKKWADETRVKVIEHNANLEEIKSTVLMTNEEKI